MHAHDRKVDDAAYPSSAASLVGLSRLRFLVSGEGDALGDLDSEAGMMETLCAGAHTLAVRCCLCGAQHPRSIATG